MSVPRLETIAFHCQASTGKEFEIELEETIEMAQDDGYTVTGIEYAMSTTDAYRVIYSAIVWSQREIIGDD